MEPAREASSEASGDVVADFQRAAEGLGRVRSALSGAIYGQDAAVELALAAVVAGGWAMIVGAPGSAKTRLAEVLGQALGLDAGRVAFTPDLELDEIVEEAAPRKSWDASGVRRSRPGPLFRQLLLADDLDRAAPKVRSALLEAAHDGAVRGFDGVRPLPRPFYLLATSTQDGVASFDETEADRFLLRIDMAAPDRSGERRLLVETAGRANAERIPAQIDPELLVLAQRLAVELPVGEKVVEAILDLVRRARPDDPSAPAIVKQAVARGPGPRAGQALMRLARARALIDGRPSPSIADVRALAAAVLKPRLVMARGGSADIEAVLTELLAGLS
ncbi:MAG: MoxR family ATPase [Proteobacteria bacterium]|nr:MoxR family ATPase [Pseudomonadota bacterium]